MDYTLEKIQHKYRKGEKLKYIFFWGHQLAEDGKISKSCFSQWWICSFKVDGVEYNCAEQFMMAEKAKLFNDMEMREKILAAKHPKQAKDFGRLISGFQEDIWLKNRFNIVMRANQAKFSQNEELKKFLMQTKNRILVEASPVDKIWGIGMAADNKNVENPLYWKGLNLLGFALMAVRDELEN
ncbi:NADAR family protein [Listeria monocytogenes]|uniref:NADAR family protein n=1 Tax=Listeria monocytogenes TaxID=1639 RepID=UPI000873B8CD|nr:NADAR family protein [Listeria monocytogenes]EAC7320055.1 NADAR family protein [Listeria monocytogenes]EAD0023377.1 NADAR family protein [Listeria monocytogenes]EAD9895868.1 NADAR family protein [Listeria monocytogenes]EAF6093707.1 NADAR family protein [Listeria monocytogenes]EDB1280248.1 NADAR family protein [Listeria monocytogenes]